MSQQWTKARFKAFIISTLRQAFRKYPTKHEVLADAFVGSKINKKTNRKCKHYKCNGCGGEFPTPDINVDHIKPVIIPDEGFVSYDKFIENLFCDKDGLQVLCTDCHDKKTKEENKLRRTNESKTRS